MKVKGLLASLVLALMLLIGLWQLTAGQGNPSNDPIWQSVSKALVPPPAEDALEGRDEPVKAHFLVLNTAALNQRLSGTPLENFAITAQSGLTMSLPLPDGDFAVFELFESPVMEPPLAAKYPDFKTYVGFGVDDKTAVARIANTPYGFTALIISTAGTIYITPVQDEEGRYYQSYYKQDVPLPIEAFIDRHPGSQHVETTVGEAGILTGSELRTYQLAVATTGEFYQNNGNSDSAVMNVIVGVVNKANLVYEQEASIRLQLIGNNEDILFDDPATDPYTETKFLQANQATLNTIIGSANYDIGHLFRGGGNGGVAGVGVVCGGVKAWGATGANAGVNAYFDEVYWHETGHQFGAQHTYNGNSGACVDQRDPFSAYEPGSGSTIMSYAALCSPQTIQDYHDPFFQSRTYEQIASFTLTGGGNACAAVTATGNAAPTANAGSGGFTIPIDTPFSLTGSGSDPDGDPLTYSWEQYNLGPAGHPNNPVSGAPIFRSFPPVTTPTRTFPQLSDLLIGFQRLGEILPTYNRTLNFRLTVRDNLGGVDYDEMSFVVTASAGPFRVIKPNGGESYAQGSSITVNWSVASTNLAPVNCANVNIARSIDGGNSFTTVLANTPNDGSAVINLPPTGSAEARIRISCSNNIFFDISDADFTIIGPLVSRNGGPCTFTTIQAAVNAAASGDTIYVTPGSYFETVLINNKNLTIQRATSNCTAVAASGLVTINGLGAARGLQLINSTVTLRGLRVLNTQAANGGGIEATNSNVTLDNTNIGPFNNSSLKGGGIYLSGGSLVLINGSLVAYNEASDQGGGVYARNGANITLWDTSSIHGNTAFAGGGLYLDDTSGLSLQNSSQIKDNTAAGFGGGIYLNSGNVSMVGTNLVANNVGSNGGGIYVNGGTANFFNTTLKNNTGLLAGGGIYALNNALITFRNSASIAENIVKPNVATPYGGGVYLDDSHLNLFDNTRVYSNTAVSGAGIYGGNGTTMTTGGTAQIYNNYTSNTGSDNVGGGFYLVNSSINLLANAKVEENTAEKGGGFYLDGGTMIMLNNSQVNDNLAIEGGGIFAANNSLVTVRDTAKLLDNRTTSPVNSSFGGAVYLDDSHLNLWLNALVQNNSARYGAGVYATNGSTLTASGDAQITANTTPTDIGTANGGAFHLANGSTMDMLNNVQVRFNSATNGGGIYLMNSSLNLFNNTLVSDNQADENGGGLYAANGSTIILQDSAVLGRTTGSARDNNTAGLNGGGAYLDNSSLTLMGNALIRSNTADNGGGVYLSGGTLSLTGSGRIENNNSPINNGGGVFAKAGAIVTVSGTAVIGQPFNNGTPNLAYNNGGGVYLTDPNTRLILNGGSRVSYNDAFDGGGVFATNQAVVEMNDTAMVANNFNTGGADKPSGIGLYSFATLFMHDSSAIQNNQDGNGLLLVSATARLDGGVISNNNQLCGVDVDVNSTIFMTNTQIINHPNIGFCLDGTAYLTDTIISNNTIGVSVEGNSAPFLSMSGGTVANNGGTGVRISRGQGRLINVTIENNNWSSGCTGLEIYPNGSLKMWDGLIQNNQAPGGSGGGLCVDGRAWLTDTAILNNTAGNNGGGVEIGSNGLLTLTNGLVSGNQAANGGGIYTGLDSKVVIVGGSVSGNQATGTGGGLSVSGLFWSLNLLVNDNQAGSHGGGLFVSGIGSAVMDSDFNSCDPKTLPANTYCSELRNNQAGTAGAAEGGAVYGSGGEVALGHTAVVGNSASGSGIGVYSTGAVTLTHTIVRNHSTIGYAVRIAGGSFHSIRSTYAANIRAILLDGGTAELQGNIIWANSIGVTLANGPILTATCNNTQGTALAGLGNISQDPLFISNVWGSYHLNLASPSIDKCQAAGGVDLINTIAPQGPLADMGAFEAYTPQIFSVDDAGLASDSRLGDSLCKTAAGVCTLQAAVEEANARPVQDTIILPIGTFPANSLLLTQPVIIQGYAPGRTFLDGTTRAFIAGTTSLPAMPVTISNLTIFGGDAGSNNGGAITNHASLTLDKVYLRDNKARNGGAVYNSPNASLTILDSTIANHSASYTILGITNGNGGGIYNLSNQPVNLTNVTISGNNAADSGGGIHHQGTGTLTLRHVTLVGNSVTESDGSGGGMTNTGAGLFTLYHTLVGNNLDLSGDGPDCSGPFRNTLSALSIVENALSPDCSWDIIPPQADPNIGPLTPVNGGPTPTHALNPGSAAIDAGFQPNCIPFDQRGYPRYGICDLGAYEYDATPTAISLSAVSIGSGSNGRLLTVIGLLMLLLAGGTLFVLRREFQRD